MKNAIYNIIICYNIFMVYILKYLRMINKIYIEINSISIQFNSTINETIKK